MKGSSGSAMSTAEIDCELRAYLASFLSDHKRELLPRLLLNRTRHMSVVIEDIYQTHNASACLRSCDCFGVQDVHVIENRNTFTENRNVALVASQWLTVHRYSDREDATSECLNALRESGHRIVMTSPHGTDCDLETYDLRQPTALVFGNEKDGASDTVRRMADHVMRIPMFGFSESFNISVAVAVCLHHLVWRMRQLQVDWQLTLREREVLLMDWVRCASGKRREALEKKFTENRDVLSASVDMWPDWSQVQPDARLVQGNRGDVRK